MGHDQYLSGEKLFGDDLGPEEIARWYREEREAYAALGAGNAGTYQYSYHGWNHLHGYRHLPAGLLGRVLAFGAAYGDELLPIIDRFRSVTILDPSDAFARGQDIRGVPARWVKPEPDGHLPFDDGTFDLITCFGVLHHVPNVTFVISELARTLRIGGHMLLREPIVSLGDWRKPRPGLTLRERGIPLHILTRAVERNGLAIRRLTLCAFPLVPRLVGLVRRDVYNSVAATRLDALLCRAFSWNINYHPRTMIQRFRPMSVYLVLDKGGSTAA